MKRLLIMSVALLSLAHPAFAIYEKGSHTVFLELGGAMHVYEVDLPFILGTVAQDEAILATSASFGAQYFYNLTPGLALGVTGHSSSTGSDSPVTSFATLLGGIVPEFESKSTVVLAVAKYSFRVPKTVMPYILAGVGFHNTTRKMTAVPSSLSIGWLDTFTREERTLVDSSGSSVAFGYGVGMDFGINEHLLLGFEFRNEILGKASYDANSQGKALGIQNLDGKTFLFNYLARIGYKF